MPRSHIVLLLGCVLCWSGCGADEEAPSILEDEAFETLDEPIDPLPVDPPARRPRTLTIFGTAYDAMGRPQEGSRVELLRRPPIGEDALALDTLKVRASTTTDDRGAWRIQAEVSGATSLRVTNTGITQTAHHPVPWAGGRIDTRAEPQIATAVGVYTPSGVPVLRAELAYVGLRHDQRVPIALGTAAHGTRQPAFAFGLPPGPAEFLVRAPGRAAVRSPAGVTLGQDDSPYAVTLPPALEIKGRVFRGQGHEPVVGAQVWVREPRLGGLIEQRRRTTADGTFEAHVSAEPGTVVDVMIRSKGYGPAYRRLVVSPALDAAPIFRLAPPQTVQGRVLDPSGAPVPGATLQWLDGFPLGDWHPDHDGPPRMVRTDAQGRFAIPWPAGAPDPDARTLLAASETHGYVAARVTEPSGTRRLRLVLGGATPIAGRVRTYKNEPLAGAAVLLARADGAPPWPRVTRALRSHLPLLHRVVTDAQGAFSFRGVPSGTWRLAVRYGEQELVDAAELHVERGTKVGDVDIHFPHGTVELRLHADPSKMLVGTVQRTRETGTRRLRGFVRLQPARGERGSNWSMRVPLPPDGHVILPGLVDMPYHVQVVAEGHLLGAVPSASPGRGVITVPIEPTPGLQIPITRSGSSDFPEPTLLVIRPSPEDYGHDRGRPITLGERPFVEAPDGALTSALALACGHQRSELLMRSPSGRVVLAALPRGSYDVALFSLDGRVSQVQAIDLPTRTTVVAPPAKFVDVASFRARLVDEAELPLRGVRCELRPADRSVMLARGRRRTRSSDDGRIAFPGLMPGPYALTVELPGGALWEQKIGVAAGSDNFVEWVARKPGTLAIHVEDADKSPVAGAHVQLLTPLGSQAGPRPTGRADDTGVLRVDGLAPGEYTVIVRKEGMAAPATFPTASVRSALTETLWITMIPAPRRGR